MLGAGDNISPFGAPRDGGSRLHQGNDITAPTLQPVVAVADGTVTKIGADEGISGRRIHIRHDDDWTTLYIHLNNDTAGTDDGNGIGVRPDLAEGDRVSAGEVIGWNGDSGNAEGTVPHLHFELRDPSGTPVDPEASLAAAERRPDDAFEGPFADFDSLDDPLTVLLSRGVRVWCGESVGEVCPDEPVDSATVDGWVAALTGSTPRTADQTGTVGGVTEADLARQVAWHQLARSHAVQVESMARDRQLWAEIPIEPPSHPRQVTLDETYDILGGHDRCLLHPDQDDELTRREAAAAVMLYRGWSAVDVCPANAWNR